ncbi:LysR family transcriptional regulator [Marinibacterium profundimaris]|uniref:LysR family transcriptional regulator n=1 Tax=Marinibacterium profundimaris TaxID=1679460 RepID=UPI001303B129|nr:LysR family transcriptional regulator [Marinibacterium profundimaris]
MDRNLAAFLAIARCGTLTAAADVLRLAQPTLTKRLKLLEDEYQAPLFERQPRGMTLTAAGRHLFEHATGIEHAYLQARETIEATKSRRLDVLRVGAGPLFRRAYLAGAFEKLRTEFPETRLVLRADVHLRNLPLLRKGELDVVFGALVRDDADETIEVRKMTDVHLGALASVRHEILSGNGPVSAEDLARTQWILYSDDPETTSMVRGYFIRHGLRPPDFTVQTTSYEFGLNLLATGKYVMPAPIELDTTFEPLGLTALPLDEPLDEFPAGAYTRRSSLQYPIVPRLLDLVAEGVGALPKRGAGGA